MTDRRFECEAFKALVEMKQFKREGHSFNEWAHQWTGSVEYVERHVWNELTIDDWR